MHRGSSNVSGDPRPSEQASTCPFKVSSPSLIDGLQRATPEGLYLTCCSCLESLSLDMVMTAYKTSGREGLVNVAPFRDFLKLLSCLLPESDCSAH